MQNIFNRTIVNYLLVMVGTFLVSKGWIPVDLWEIFRGAFEEVILVVVGGGGLVAIITGAARGILESQKSKVSVNGQSVALKELSPKAQQVIVSEVKREVVSDPNIAVSPKARRSLEDILKGQ